GVQHCPHGAADMGPGMVGGLGNARRLMLDSVVLHALYKTEAFDITWLFPKMPYRSRPPGKACKNKLLRQNCPITTLESNMSLWLFPLDDRLILREPLPLFVQPERVKAHHVIDPEVISGVMPLDVVIPPVVEPLPGHRE